MDFTDTPAEAAFREEVRAWLAEHLVGEFAALGPGGGPADETGWDVRLEWEHILGKDRWVGLSWPTEYGGRGADLAQQIIFNEEYARANAPARISFFGEGLFAPTLIQFGTDEQKRRFLPKIQRVEELWCQGFSEPNAGSDLANIQTRATLDGDEWVITGQKVWTTLAHRADWCFVVCRTDPESKSHKGLSYVLVPMQQDGIEVRPLRQMTGSAEFNEVFFDGARTAKDNVLGPVGEGWKVAMATLGFERGTAFMSSQLAFEGEYAQLLETAQKNGAAGQPALRDELAQRYIGLQVMKYNGMRMLTNLVHKGVLGPEASIGKLFWTTWHKAFGETAMRVEGADALTIEAAGPGVYEVDELERIFLSSRAETIYAGASEIQRNIIGERVLGLPREPK
jgi:alkylation response protein AidB-like acyl-CoA dehydrogenase